MKKTLTCLFMYMVLTSGSPDFRTAAAQAPPPPPFTEITVTDSTAPVDDHQIPFSDVTAGSTSDNTVTIGNSGNSGLAIGIIAQADVLQNPFSIVVDACSGQTVLPTETCTFTVRFSPSAPAVSSDTFDIPSNDPGNNPVTFSVSGTGVTVPVPDISLSDSRPPALDHELPFSDITEGNSVDETITISNGGNGDLTIGSIALSDPLLAPFTLDNDPCSGQTLVPGGSCTLTVRFAPAAAGTFTQTFDIPSNDPDGPSVTFDVSGSGLAYTANNPPSAPTPAYPAHGQTGLGTTVTFKWKKSQDPDGDPVTYNFYLCEDEALTLSCSNSIVTASLQNPIYYAGLGGPAAAFLLLGWGFVIAGGEKIRKRISLYLCVIVFAGFTTLSCGGGGGGGSSSSGTSTIDTGGSGTSSEDITYDASNLKDNTTYYWKVVAQDSNGGETESPVVSFETN